MIKKIIIGFIVLLLIVLNAINLWQKEENTVFEKNWLAISLQELKLNGISSKETSYVANSRNPFLSYSDQDGLENRAENVKQVESLSKLALIVTRNAGELKLMGFVKRKKVYEAFVIHRDVAYTVSKNQKIGDNFKVKGISSNSITVLDIKRNKIFTVSLVN